MDWLKLQENTKKKLDEISPSFCLAKWLQVTLHLQTGLTHSCHHPIPRKIPLDEIIKDPGALHNTRFKREMRQLMIDGEYPAECNYCWDVERMGNDEFSDRVIKSSDPWASPFFAEVIESGDGEGISPRYLEVSFGSNCNLGCIYCSPDVSSTIWKDFENHGSFPTVKPENELHILEKVGKKPYLEDQENPYVTAFWKWFPVIRKDLRFFRITGGEPLLNKNTNRVLESISEDPVPQLDLSINSNLMLSENILNQFIGHINKLIAGKKINTFTLYTSVDCGGRGAEFIRCGLSYKKWLANIRKYLEEAGAPVTVMVTYTLLSASKSFQDFLKDLLDLYREFGVRKNSELNLINLDISYLHQPEYLSVRNADADLIYKMEDQLIFMKKNSISSGDLYGFTSYEINKMARTISVARDKSYSNNRQSINRYDFFNVILEYEKRRGLSFRESFPDLLSFLNKSASMSTRVWWNHYIMRVCSDVLFKANHPLIEDEIDNWIWRKNSASLLQSMGAANHEIDPIGDLSLDLSFSNRCDHFCSYCTEDECSRIRELNKEDSMGLILGEVSMDEALARYGRNLEEQDGKREKFWRELPNYYQRIKELRLSGGEPLLESSVWKLLEYIELKPLPGLLLELDSSLSVDEKLVQDFISKAQELEGAGKIGSFNIATRMDSSEEQADFIRGGTDYLSWKKSVEYYLINSKGYLRILVNFTIFSCGNKFEGLLKYICDLRKRFGSHRLMCDFKYCYFPEYLSLSTGDEEIFLKARSYLQFLRDNSCGSDNPWGFLDKEVISFERIIHRGELTRVYDEKRLASIRFNLKNFIIRHEKRVGTSFGDVFQELKGFYKACDWSYYNWKGQTGQLVQLNQLGWDMRTNPISLLNFAKEEENVFILHNDFDVLGNESSSISLDLSFSNRCDSFCIYCSGDECRNIDETFKSHNMSHVLGDDSIEKQLRSHKFKLLQNGEGEQLFWNCLPSFYSKLGKVKISGGEPLLDENNFTFFDYLLKNPLSQLILELDTSFMAPGSQKDRCFQLLSNLLEKKCIARFNLLTSMDSAGEQGEFIRWGASYKIWFEQVVDYLEHFSGSLRIQINYTFLCCGARFIPFLEDIISLRKKFGASRIFCDFRYNYQPEYLSLSIVNDELFDIAWRQLAFIKECERGVEKEWGFTTDEINTFKALIERGRNEFVRDERILWDIRFKLKNFLNYYEKRVGAKARDVFPELGSFWNLLYGEHLVVRPLGDYLHRSSPARMFERELGWKLRHNPTTLIDHRGHDPLSLLDYKPGNTKAVSCDVAIGNHCDFHCVYCSADESSRILLDRSEYGKYELLDWQDEVDELKGFNVEVKEYSLESLKQINTENLKSIRLTGGEPTQHSNINKIVDEIPDGCLVEIESSLGATNLATTTLMERILLKSPQLRVVTTMDSVSKKAEYIRGGISFELWQENLESLLRIDGVSVEVSTIYTILSCDDSFIELQEYLLNLRESLRDKGRLVLNYVHCYKPKFLCVTNGGEAIRSRIQRHYKWVKEHPQIFLGEKKSFKNILHVATHNTSSLEDTVVNRACFAQFIQQYDNRYGQTFVDVFPQLREFYQESVKLLDVVQKSVR